MTIKLILSVFILIPGMALAQKTKGQVDVLASAEMITVKPKKGFYLNDKAPASVVFDHTEAKLKPETKTEVLFAFKILPKAKKAKLEFYVCDNEKTVCEKHDHDITLNQKKAQQALLSFTAPWCPACIRLKSETLNKEELKKILTESNIDIQEINIDLVENEKIANKFSVKAIPTLILVNDKNDELKRWLDYLPASALVPDLALAIKTNQPIEKLLIAAKAGNLQAAEDLGFNYYSKMEWALASEWLAKAQGTKAHNYKLAADVALSAEKLSEAKDTKVKHLALLEKAALESKSVIDQARWNLEALELKLELTSSEELQENNSEAVGNKQLIASTKALSKAFESLYKDKNLKQLFVESTLSDHENFEQIEILDMQKRLDVLVKNKDSEISRQKQMLKQLDQMQHRMDYPGQVISAIWYYGQAGSSDKAEGLIKNLISTYGKTYVYYQRYANFLLKQKRFEEALEQINLALEYKFGNEPQLNLSKIKILKELKKTKEAKSLIKETLKITRKYPTKYKRTQSALLDLQKQI